MAGNRITKDDYDNRVKQCYSLRFDNQNTFGIKEWLAYCQENYSDKSQQHHCKMWSDAGELYQEGWKEKLNRLLEPASDELYRLLSSEDEKIRQRALDQIMKYTGNDIQKIDAVVSGEIIIKFGDE